MWQLPHQPVLSPVLFPDNGMGGRTGKTLKDSFHGKLQNSIFARLRKSRSLFHKNLSLALNELG